MAGYHTKDIPKGILGQISKIQEELDELKDADSQGVKILMLCELADLVGAIDAYLKNSFPNVHVKDLLDMAQLTAKAFRDGQR
jgi:hypothetical protein